MQESLSAAKTLATWQTEAQMVMLTSSPERQVEASSAHGESGAGQGREETCQRMGWGSLANKIKTVVIKIHTTWHTCNASAKTKKRQQYSGGMLV